MEQLKILVSNKHFPFLRLLKKQFPAAEVFLVGGIIRDTLLKRASKDYDFVVRNVPLKKLQPFLASLGWVDLVGKTFGVLKFLPQGAKDIEPIDIALPRTEHALLTGGYRDVKVQSDPRLPIEQDLQRRDFTINALAFNITNGELIDRFGGLKDLRDKKIRCVGQPAERFREDYSRMLRAIRFACQLDFQIEPKTWAAVKKMAPKINSQWENGYIVPRETIAKELVKSFLADPAQAFLLYDSAGLTKQLMPELLKMKKCPQPKNFHSEGDVWKHTYLCLQNLRSKKFQKKFQTTDLSAELVLATLFHDLGKPFTIERLDRLRFNNHDAVGADLALKIMERLKISSANVDIGKVSWLCSHHMLATHTKKSAMKRTTLEKYFYNEQVPGLDLLKLTFADIMATVPPSGRPDFSTLKKLERQIAALKKNARTTKQLPPEILDGHEIMKFLKIVPGPEIGKLKEVLREAQLQGTITTKEQARTFLTKHAHLRN